MAHCRQHVSYAIHEMLIQCCGNAQWYCLFAEQLLASFAGFLSNAGLELFHCS